jgi:hypothetical protein
LEPDERIGEAELDQLSGAAKVTERYVHGWWRNDLHRDVL